MLKLVQSISNHPVVEGEGTGERVLSENLLGFMGVAVTPVSHVFLRTKREFGVNAADRQRTFPG